MSVPYEITYALDRTGLNVALQLLVTEDGLPGYQTNNLYNVADPDLGEWGKGGDNASATVAYTFNDGTVPGKMQLGSGWWFLDQEDGMRKQMNALSALGLFSRFVGMLTDSRSFLSYPRHEYFRRILCSVLGEDIEKGKLPKSEMAFIHQMVKDISYNNAARYFNF